MSNMKTQNFSFRLQSAQSASTVFTLLQDPQKWWTGLYNEELSGTHAKPGDAFTFKAGNGAHYSRQELVESIPGKKITWKVTDSRLAFLEKQDEWNNTMLCFDIEEKDGGTIVVFTHKGLVPAIACYDQCTAAWTRYFENLQKILNSN